MASKEIKKFLKLAKDCIDKKDFISGAQQCKNALLIDEDNYMALVLLGACLQETEQKDEAKRALKKAAMLSPEMPLAWKGLASFFERENKEKDRKDLLEAYIHLLKAEEDLIKSTEWCRKIGVLLSLLEQKVLIETWTELLEINSEKKKILLKTYLSVFGEMEENISEGCLPIVEAALEHCLENRENIYLIATYKKYFRLLFKMQNLDKLMRKAREMYDQFPAVLAGPEWFCKAYLEAKFGYDSYQEDIPEPSEMYMKLLTQVPDSYLGYACKGVDELTCQEYVAACESLQRAVQLKSNYGIAWYLLTQGQVWIHRFVDAEYSARQAIKFWKLRENNVQNITNCKYWLAKALCFQNSLAKLAESIRIADEFLFDNPNRLDFLFLLVKAAIKLGDASLFSKYFHLLEKEDINNSEKLFLNALWLKETGDLPGYQRSLTEATAGLIENYEIWLEIGMIEYQRGELKSSLIKVLKATKMNEWCPVNYRYLGHIYRKMGDLAKARRCYQKAFHLSPYDFEAGIGLSDVYRALGLEEENLKLLSVACEIPGARWAWLKLGLHYLAVGNPPEAVRSLRAAVRLNSADKDAWESLGDAYLALGSHAASLKSYQKVIEFDSKAVYPLLQIATCKHLQGENRQAVIEFRQVLRLQPDFLPALKSHAVSCLALMRTQLDNNLIGLAADSCQEAVTSLARSLEIRGDLVCLWKLLGDACLLMAKLPANLCRLTCPTWLTIEKTEHIEKESILRLGARSFYHAIGLAPKREDLWYDAALCYNELAECLPEGAERKDARNLAVANAKKCLIVQGNYWRGWNLLGLIYMAAETRNYRLAQHCFLKAISLDSMSHVSWTNLGSLYLILGDLQLANQSFTEAQRCNPSYVQSWVGQAIVAEATGHHEAMDLFRHSTQLGFHPEGALGYSSMVLSKILNTSDLTDEDYIFSIKNMNAVVIACDVANWCADRYPLDSCCLNMLGLLQERLGLFRSAAESFQRALSTLSPSTGDIKDKILLNHGRVLLRMKKIDDCIKTLKGIEEASFESECLLAHALTKNEDVEEAYDSYQKALEWLAKSDEDKSHVLIALAALMYPQQGYEDTKLLLMQACQLQPVPIPGLFACCALGLLHSDESLAELALQELCYYPDHTNLIDEIALLQSYTALITGEVKEAQRILRDTAHRHPEKFYSWFNYGVVNLMAYPSGKPRDADICFRRALRLGNASNDQPKVFLYASLGNLLSGNIEESLKCAKKAAHLYPAAAENWAVLLAAKLAQGRQTASTADIAWMKAAISGMKNREEVSDEMKRWLENCEIELVGFE